MMEFVDPELSDRHLDAGRWCCTNPKHPSCHLRTAPKVALHYEPAGHLVHWEPERRWNWAGVAVTLAVRGSQLPSGD